MDETDRDQIDQDSLDLLFRIMGMTRQEATDRILEIERLPPSRARRLEWMLLHNHLEDG